VVIPKDHLLGTSPSPHVTSPPKRLGRRRAPKSSPRSVRTTRSAEASRVTRPLQSACPPLAPPHRRSDSVDGALRRARLARIGPTSHRSNQPNGARQRAPRPVWNVAATEVTTASTLRRARFVPAPGIRSTPKRRPWPAPKSLPRSRRDSDPSPKRLVHGEHRSARRVPEERDH